MPLPLPQPRQRACTAARPRAGARAWQAVWLACLLLALADGLLASAPGLPVAPSTHHAPVGLVQHGWVLHRALFQARAPPAALRA